MVMSVEWEAIRAKCNTRSTALIDDGLSPVTFITERLQVGMVVLVSAFFDRLDVIDLTRGDDLASSLVRAAQWLHREMRQAQTSPRALVIEPTRHQPFETRRVNMPGTSSPSSRVANAFTRYVFP